MKVEIKTVREVFEIDSSNKVVEFRWMYGEENAPSLAEIIQTAEKEFSGIPFEKLEYLSNNFSSPYYQAWLKERS